jgi:hypothetical protein
MHQANIAAMPGVFQGLFFRYQMPKLRVDLQHRLPQENTAVLQRVILAMVAAPADAEVHDPVIAGALDKMLDHPGGQNHVIRLLDRFVDLDGLVLWQVDNIIPLKQAIIHKPVNRAKRNLSGKSFVISWTNQRGRLILLTPFFYLF